MTSRCIVEARVNMPLIAMLGALLILTICGHLNSEAVAFASTPEQSRSSTSVRALAPGGTSVVVLLFFATDCPISDRYQPEVSRLNHLFKDRGVQFWMVYPNPSETRVGTEAHQKHFSQDIAPLLDPQQSLVKLAGARVTPEAAVFRVTPHGLEKVYRGRIDDRYLSLGTQRPQALHHDLSDAIDAALSDKPVDPAGGRAVGCSIIPLP